MLQSVISQLLKEIEQREQAVSDLKRALVVLGGNASTPPRNGYHSGSGAQLDSLRVGSIASRAYLAIKANPDGIHASDLASEIGKTTDSTHSTLNRLKQKGLIESCGVGRWKSVEANGDNPIVTPVDTTIPDVRGVYRPKIVAYLKNHPNGSSPLEIRKATGINHKTVCSGLQAMRRKGALRSLGHGRWVLAGGAGPQAESQKPSNRRQISSNPSPRQDQVLEILAKHPNGLRLADVTKEFGEPDKSHSISVALDTLKKKGLVDHKGWLWIAVGEKPKPSNAPGGAVQLRVYNAVQKHPNGATGQAIAEELGFTKNSTSSFLSQMNAKGYIRHEGNLYLPNR